MIAQRQNLQESHQAVLQVGPHPTVGAPALPDEQADVASNKASATGAPRQRTALPTDGAAIDRQQLNPKAKAWTPVGISPLSAMGGSSSNPVPLGDWPLEVLEPPATFVREVRQQISISVSNMRASLKNNVHVARVDALKGLNFWAITVRMISAQFQQHKDTVLLVAREALLHSVQVSGCMYLIGFRTMPFIVVPHGFVTMLGGMRDPMQACWSTFETGTCCHRQTGCPWQHPVCRTVINVTVKLTDEP